jgi:hypothetical protein
MPRHQPGIVRMPADIAGNEFTLGQAAHAARPGLLT